MCFLFPVLFDTFFFCSVGNPIKTLTKLHPDPNCAVLCRYPMWRPFPSLFRNNWSCHRHSDAAARSHTLDSTCSSGILTPQPPALSWTVVVGSPSQDLCNPSHLELSQSYADAIQALQTRQLSVDLSSKQKQQIKQQNTCS